MTKFGFSAVSEHRRFALAALAGVSALSGIGLSMFGCNTLAGNDEGILRASDITAAPDAGTEDATPPTPLPTCAASEKVCFGTCVEKLNPGFGCADDATCEACAQPSHATATCAGGACGSTCKKGYDDCEKSAADCETDLSSASTCGSCNTKCVLSTPFCAPVGDTFQCVATCAPGTDACGTTTQCFDLDANVSHCGKCGNPCPEPQHSTATCSGGACGFTCHPGFHACGGACVGDLDITACGPSCVACPARPHATAVCSKGACGVQCLPGWADCDGNLANGCEKNITSDSANCGACGVSCKKTVDDRSIEPLAGPAPGNCCVNSKCTWFCPR